MDEAVDSTFELGRLESRRVAVICGASSSALEATPSRFTRLEATSERSRGHSKPPGSPLEPARSRRKASSSLLEPSGGLPERSPGSRILEKTRENSRKLRSEPLERQEPLERARRPLNALEASWSVLGAVLGPLGAALRPPGELLVPS